MPWIEVSEPHAKPPRRTGPRSATQPVDRVDLDDSWAEIVGISLEGEIIDVSSCSTLGIRSSRLDGVSFENADNVEIDAHEVEFRNCDLSRVRFRSLTASALTACKLTGTDFSGGVVRDTSWISCRFSLANLRMAGFERVSWEDCVIEETDLFDSSITDAAFDGTAIRDLSIDRTRLERVDFRAATELGLSNLTSLEGALFAPEQLPALSFTLATALGADVEADTEPAPITPE